MATHADKLISGDRPVSLNPDSISAAHASNGKPVPRSVGVRRWLFVVCDAFAVWAGETLFLRFHAPVPENAPQAGHPVRAHLLFVLLYSVLLLLVSHTQGLYSAYQSASRRQELLSVFHSVFFASLLVLACIYAFGSPDLSPLAIGFPIAWSFVSMVGWRQLRRYFLQRAVADGVTCHNVVIVGTGPHAQALGDLLTSHRHLGFLVLGFLSCGKNSQQPVASPSGSPLRTNVIGSLADLPRLCRTQFVDEIILCSQQRRVVKTVIATAKHLGVGVRLLPDLYGGVAGGTHMDYLGDFPTFCIVHRNIPALGLKLKRFLDVIASASALVLLSPVFIAIALLVKLDSRGPVFYSSQRVGRKGRLFSCFKFRTMVLDADKMTAHLQHLNERDGILFKLRDDPRVTKAGRFLRKYSLDELAQLWNVLKGDMSLVGPRPPLASEVKQYELTYYRRLDAAPGITGLWQVEARTSPSFQDYISLDLSYVNTWSLGLDLKILFRTIGAVLAGTGS